ncbi:MAG: GTP-binding protein [Theionarchaea archaeon]|nr:GTP-binding protein [Theionarchaea archaeon]MBU7000200.1 GTP-binding protein [Theionarchaea archaeon]MBU7020917.1 GTP-binding protein [Theionarchaea archaeon]MBU7033969.1 GTP-binding protein [Theionarchaea archaeon]MBU7040535.1 GTP-binding protein [Theionarchaea archaeon]
MPTNVTPEYLAAEEESRQAKNPKDRLRALEKMLTLIPKHKGTEKMQMQIKRRISRTKEEMEAKSRKAGHGPVFNVKKEGAAQVALVGIPNSGKSSVLTQLTNADAQVGDYPFTTTIPTPGMLEYKDVQIQLVEIPALIQDVSVGKGFGLQILSAIRAADAVAIVIDLSRDSVEQMKIILDELEKGGVRLNENPPDIEIVKKAEGGIEIRGRQFFFGDEQVVKELLLREKVHNAIVVFRGDTTVDQFQEALDESTAFRPALVLATKGDVKNSKEQYARLREQFSSYEIVPISAEKGINLEPVKEAIFRKLQIIRVYTKTPGEEVAYPPITMKPQSTVHEAAGRIHKQFQRKFKYARIWGPSAKYEGQKVGSDHVLQDGDIVEVHIR